MNAPAPEFGRLLQAARNAEAILTGHLLATGGALTEADLVDLGGIGDTLTPLADLRAAIAEAAALFPPLTAAAIAKEFCAVLRQWLTPEQLAEAVARNAAETDPGICHSHDFCDANCAMHEAFVRCGLDPHSTGVPDTDHPLQSAECDELWDEAWTLAKARGFAR